MSKSRKLIQKFFRFLYWLLYHPLAWAYDLIAAIVSGNRWKQWVFSVLPHLTGPKVLEIGHGPGHLHIEMRKRGLFTVGIDASWAMNRLGLRNTTHHRLNTMLINGYAQLLPLPSFFFDQVVATFPAEFIYDSQALQEVRRVLKPGGQFVILPGALIHSNKPYDRFLSWLFRFSGLSPVWSEPFLALLRRTGFEASSIEQNLGDSSIFIIIATKST